MAGVYRDTEDKDCVIVEAGGWFYGFYTGVECKTLREVEEELGVRDWRQSYPLTIACDAEPMTAAMVERCKGEYLGEIAHEFK